MIFSFIFVAPRAAAAPVSQKVPASGVASRGMSARSTASSHAGDHQAKLDEATVQVNGFPLRLLVITIYYGPQCLRLLYLRDSLYKLLTLRYVLIVVSNYWNCFCYLLLVTTYCYSLLLILVI